MTDDEKIPGPKPYTPEEKERIVALLVEQGMSRKQALKAFEPKWPKRPVVRIVRRNGTVEDTR